MYAFNVRETLKARRVRRPDAFFFTLKTPICQTEAGQALSPEFPLLALFRFAGPLMSGMMVKRPQFKKFALTRRYRVGVCAASSVT
ncbi:MAG: hypothetical protein ACKVP2_01030 [Burkholderiales bacterium]